LVECQPERYLPKGEVLGLLTTNTWAAPALVNVGCMRGMKSHLVCVDLTP